MKEPHSETLQTIITRLMIIQQTLFIVVVIIVFAVSSHWSAKIAIQQARKSTLLIANNVRDYLRSTEHALAALAVSEPTQSGLDSVRAGFNEFDVIYYILSNGKLDKISPRTSLITVGMDMSSQPFFNSDQKGVEISTPFTSSRSGKPTVYMSLPLLRGGGVIVGEVNLSQLQDRIINESTSETGYSFIIDRFGYFIAHPDLEKVASQENIRPTRVYQIALKGTSELVYLWDGNLYIYTIEPIAGTDWSAINRLPFWTVYGPFLIPAISGLLVAIGFIFISMRRQRQIISRRVIDPLELLTDQAQRISSGNYLDLNSHPFAPEAYAEVNVLMKSISLMEYAVKTRESDNFKLLFDVQRHLNQERLLRDIDVSLTTITSPEQTIQTILTRINNRLKIDASSIYLYRPEKRELIFFHNIGFKKNQERSNQASYENVIKRFTRESKLLYIPDLEKAKEKLFRSIYHDEDLRSYIGIPLYAREHLIGILNLFTHSAYIPANDGFDFLKLVGLHTAVAIDSTRMFYDLQSSNLEMLKAYDSTLEGWSRAMDLRDRETEGHTLRVTELSEKLAKRMRIPDEQLIHIKRGALLHDIGKIAVPDAILLKPGPLTAEEWEVMRYHPQYARDFLMSIEYLRPAMDIPSHHHEHWDGSG
jgi:HD-GYP domain-containing protein (c-di-GMP phosphodiesterase class II)